MEPNIAIDDADVKALLEGQRLLITGGTGSFGHAFTERILQISSSVTVVIYSRDEAKHERMERKFGGDSRLRFFIGDVRDEDRLYRAMAGVTTVVHAAAMKVVPTCEYNPFEAVKTNIMGTQNVCEASLHRGVGYMLGLSSDKACQPINLYGATKLAMEKIIIGSNAYSGGWTPRFSCVRYGNVAGSRGSVVPLWRTQKHPSVTDMGMTRFWMTLPQAVELVLFALLNMAGGEIFIPKLPSFTLSTLVEAMDLNNLRIIGRRPGEKDNESLIGVDEIHLARRFNTHYILRPTYAWHDIPEGGEIVTQAYTSASNHFLSVADLKEELKNV